MHSFPESPYPYLVLTGEVLQELQSSGSGRWATCHLGGARRGSPLTAWCGAGPGRRCTASGGCTRCTPRPPRWRVRAGSGWSCGSACCSSTVLAGHAKNIRFLLWLRRNRVPHSPASSIFYSPSTGFWNTTKIAPAIFQAKSRQFFPLSPAVFLRNCTLTARSPLAPLPPFPLQSRLATFSTSVLLCLQLWGKIFHLQNIIAKESVIGRSLS